MRLRLMKCVSVQTQGRDVKVPDNFSFSEIDKTYWRRKHKDCPSEPAFKEMAEAEEKYFSEERSMSFIEAKNTDNVVQVTDLQLDFVEGE